MLEQPRSKYAPFPPIDLPDRQWPSQRITSAPQWLSTDLRDGNQAIFEPMDGATKLEFFQMLTRIGFKEIEIGFPSASQIEFDFVRGLIEEKHIPDDVAIQVLTQARPDLIERTMESVRGAKQAVIHFYVATSDEFREMVLGKSQEEVVAMAVASTRQIRELAEQQPETKFTLEFSPEHFSQTPLPFARDICDAVVEAWGATPERKVILNLPATVEICDPCDYADMIEWMGRNLKKRDSVIISVHPHNDRGTAVSAAEMALKAGADRIEGCLLGNGERTGNVDLVTLALNMYTRGVHPDLDFSNIDEIARAVEGYTQIDVHPRHPYVGDLVNTAFSGSHQDAIRKGLSKMGQTSHWIVPYLPIDPNDIGRDFTNVVRVNSQSGKGGISYLLESSQGITMPRRLQIEFSGVVQKYAEATKSEISPEQIWSMFQNEYLNNHHPIKYLVHKLAEKDGNEPQSIWLAFEAAGKEVTLLGEGNGPIDAAINALNLPVNVQSYEEHSLGTGSDAKAISFVEMAVEGIPGTHYGVGIHDNFVTASILAVISGINRGMKQGKLEQNPDFEAHAVVTAPHHPSTGGGGSSSVEMPFGIGSKRIEAPHVV